jgi:hypothetical protein
LYLLQKLDIPEASDMDLVSEDDGAGVFPKGNAGQPSKARGQRGKRKKSRKKKQRARKRACAEEAAATAAWVHVLHTPTLHGMAANAPVPCVNTFTLLVRVPAGTLPEMVPDAVVGAASDFLTSFRSVIRDPLADVSLEGTSVFMRSVAMLAV